MKSQIKKALLKIRDRIFQRLGIKPVQTKDSIVTGYAIRWNTEDVFGNIVREGAFNLNKLDGTKATTIIPDEHGLLIERPATKEEQDTLIWYHNKGYLK